MFDWKTNQNLKFSSSMGIYSAEFQWELDSSLNHYFLDLGTVSYTIEVFINGKYAGKRIFAPYLLDVTSLLKPGINSIEVHVTPGQLNGFIGNAKKGDKRYNQFKDKEDKVMSAGLVGPVVLRPEKQL